MKPKFKIVEKKENPYETMIESITVDKVWKTTFTLNELEKNISELNTKKRELESVKQVEEAKIQNIKNNHPNIDLDIDEKVQIAYAINQKAKSLIKSCDEKLKQIEDILTQEGEDLKEIFKQTGIKLPEKNE